MTPLSGRFDYARSRSRDEDQDEPAEPVDHARLSYRWNVLFSAVLTRFRKRFGGDLDQFLIYMVFVEGEAARSLLGEKGTGPRGLNGLSLAEITGVPRESVRRKLRILTERGYLRHGCDGLHYLSDGGRDEICAELERLFLAAGGPAKRRA